MSKQGHGRVIVQHSGYGYRRDPQFERGLESRQLGSARERARVEAAGGLVFDSYTEAEDFCEQASYPSNYFGLIPLAQGTFSDQVVDGLRIYVPVREVVG